MVFFPRRPKAGRWLAAAAAPALGIFILSTASPAAAGEVVARVDGVEITTDELQLAETDFAAQLQRIPKAQHRQVLLDVLVDIHVLARAAEREGLDKGAEFADRLAFLKARALRNAYFKKRIEDEITEADLRRIYDREIGKLVPEDEIKASHILVKTRAEAEAILAELRAGRDFAELAREKSIDPTAKRNGGDLGYFTRGRMVKSFEDAAFALKAGQLSAPVESQFGWHVIRMEDRRKQQPPTFEEVREQIARVALQEKYTARMDELKKTIRVEILDGAGSSKEEGAGAQ